MNEYFKFMIYSGIYSLMLGLIYMINKTELTADALIYGGVLNILIGLLLVLTIKFVLQKGDEQNA